MCMCGCLWDILIIIITFPLLHLYYRMRPQKLPLPFNETEWAVRGPRVFSVHFESVLIKYYIRIA